MTPKNPATCFVAIVGKSNVGKSTLLNNLMGEKIAAVSNKPQTTRTRITGVLTKENVQYVFLDTPGIHRARNRLGEEMNRMAVGALTDVNCTLLVVEPTDRVHPVEASLLERFKKEQRPVVLIINKCDTIKKSAILPIIDMYAKHYDFDALLPISAKTGEGMNMLFEELHSYEVESDWYFPSDMITDQPERVIVAETIREKLLKLLSEEVPHGIYVVIEEMKDIRGHLLDIRAEIFCERESHKHIIIGKDGSMLKQVGIYAREDLEAFFGIKVNLNLWVKVKEKWRDNSALLNRLGLKNED